MSMFTPIPPPPAGMKYTFVGEGDARELALVPVDPAEEAARERHRAEVDAQRRRRREVRARMFERDWRAMIALGDARRAENAAARERAQSSPGLCAALLADAQRRGRAEIDWPAYFRNAGISL